ncbi:hypothetical protein KEM56_004220, partial [Ascosphaera pollenicola]
MAEQPKQSKPYQSALEMTPISPDSLPSGGRPYSSVHTLTSPENLIHFNAYDPASGARSSAVELDDNAEAEEQRPPRYTEENDPLRLSESLKSRDELKEIIRPNMSLKRNVRGAKLQKFYKNQNENIHRLLRPVDEHRRQAKEAGEANQVRYKIGT